MKWIAVCVVGALIAAVAGVACGSFSGSEESTPAPDAASADGAVTPLGEAGGPDAASEGSADAGLPDDAEVRARLVGCSDGTREGFVNSGSAIAACQGAWDRPGVLGDRVAQCSRKGGNDGIRMNGTGCGAEDLCAFTWHVCRDAQDVGASGGALEGEICMSFVTDGGTFYATAQAGSDAGLGVCVSTLNGGFNDVFGCGDIGNPPDSNACVTLNAVISQGKGLVGFNLSSDTMERAVVTKLQGVGGVLCCHD